MAKTIKTKQDTPFQYEYSFDDKPWDRSADPGDRIKNWTVPYNPPEIPGSAGRYGFNETIFPAHGTTMPTLPDRNQTGGGGTDNISAERQRIMGSIKRRALETVPEYDYNTDMPERPQRIERQIEGRNSAGAEIPGNVDPESQVQAALRRLMSRRG
jgi:hypothetical protein